MGSRSSLSCWCLLLSLFGCGDDTGTGASAAGGAGEGAASSVGAGSATGGAGTGAGSQGGSTSTTGGGGAGGAAPLGRACSPGVAGPTVASFVDTAPFAAQAGTTYSGLRVQNPDGPCITVTDASSVIIVDSDIGPCGGEAAIVVSGASDDVHIERSSIHDSARGVLASSMGVVVTQQNHVFDIAGVAPQGTAIEYDYMAAGGVIGHNCIEGVFGSDVVSGFESSNLSIVGNEIHADITEPSAAGFTIGDSVAGSPGHDNYVADNQVFQTGGVPPGVFGSSGNTLLENNCLPSGIQAYAYNGPFVGVTVQYNQIGPGWFVPDTSVVAGWDTNTFTDGSGCPE